MPLTKHKRIALGFLLAGAVFAQDPTSLQWCAGNSTGTQDKPCRPVSEMMFYNYAIGPLTSIYADSKNLTTNVVWYTSKGLIEVTTDGRIVAPAGMTRDEAITLLTKITVTLTASHDSATNARVAQDNEYIAALEKQVDIERALSETYRKLVCNMLRDLKTNTYSYCKPRMAAK